MLVAVLLVLGVIAPRATAQILEPDALTIPVDLRARAYAVSGTGSLSGSYLSGSGGTAGFDVNGGSPVFTPGLARSISVTLTNVSSAQVQFSPPPGHRCYINDVLRTRIELTGSGAQVLSVRIESDRGGAFGASSSFRAGPNHVIMAFGLGNLSNGRSAGVITLREPTASNHYFTPASLLYENSNPEVDRILVSGVLRQIYVFNGLVDIQSVTNASFRMKFFPRTQVGAQLNGLYEVSGDPLYDYLIENPAYPTAHNTQRVTRTINQGGASHVMWSQTTVGYTIIDWVDKPSGATSVSGPISKTWTSSTSGTSYSDASAVALTGVAGSTATAESRTYDPQSWGTNELTSRTVGSGASALTTTFTYTDKRVATETETGGGWKKFDYYSDLDRYGQVYRVYKPYMDSPSTVAGASTTSGEVTTYDYAADWTGRKSLPSSVVTAINGTTTAKTEFTYDHTQTLTDVSRNYSSTPINPPTSNSAMALLVTTRKDYYDATHYLTTITKTFREDADPQFKYFGGLPHSEQKPDGTMTVAVYFRGTFNKSSREFSASKDGSEVLKRTFNGTATSGSGSVAMTSFTMGDQTQATESNFYVVQGLSTAEDIVMAADGTIICKQSLIYAAESSTYAWHVVQRDVNNYVDGIFLASTMRDSGNVAQVWAVVTNGWTKGRMDYSIDETGIRTDLTYDSSGRVLTKKRVSASGLSVTIADLTTTVEYDAAGRVKKETVAGNGLSETLTTSRVFDTAGRVVSETTPGYATAGASAASAVTTSYTYDPSNRKVTVTLPTGSTKIETKYLDGQLYRRNGTGEVAEYHTYGVESDGRRHTTVNLATASDARKRDTWVDMLGREAKKSRPSFTGVSPTTFAEENFFDDFNGQSTGRLIKSTRTDYAPQLNEYNALSQVVRSGLHFDSGSSLNIAASSTDRVSDTARAFNYSDSAWWLKTTTSAYPYSDSTAGTAVVMATERKRLTGLTNSLRGETRTLDAEGNETRVTTTVDAAAKTVTKTTRRPGMVADSTEKSLNGLAIEATGHDGLTVKKRYDALGRATAVIEPRTGTETNPTTRTTYHQNTTWPRETKDAANKRLSYTHYDGAGRVIYTEDAHSKTTRTSYTVRGEVEYVWGSATYPVSYAYSVYGEKTKLRTYRDPSGVFTNDSATWPGGSATADETTWVFDEPSGLLKKKIDAAGKFVEYTYNARGQTATRKWARTLPGSETKVTTTYAYYGDSSGEAKTGELRLTSYNDGPGGTPSVGYTYTRSGQPKAVTDVTGTRLFVYNSSKPWQLDAESMDDYYNDRQLTRTYETATSTSGSAVGEHTPGTVLGRPNGLKLGTSGAPADEMQITYEVSNSGRFAGLVSARGSTSRHFIYGYETNSALLKTLSIDGSHPFSITRTFEPYRDLLTEIEAKWNGTARTKYAYTYDSLRRRETVVQSGDVFADYGGPDSGAIHQIFTYNSRSEVTGAATFLGATPTDQSTPLSARKHEFAYDGIGNRKTSNTSGRSDLADDYTVNALNQYTARDNSTLAVGGTADADARVVAGENASALAGRAGSHWGDNLVLPNTSGPYRGPLKVFAAKNVGGTDRIRSETVTALIPPAAESFTYDDDGNILTDGVWVYKWDAENRLIEMATKSAVIGAGISADDARKLEFAYDYQHRRVEKIVRSGWNGSVFSTTALSTTRFLYDDWNLLAEYSVSSGTISVIRSYTWGLDIATDMKKAGGVGALLQIRDDADAKDYFPSYDGNGNLTALFDGNSSGSGACVAAYEFAPFGEAVRSEGGYSAKNPFGFSTKFTDYENGLIYFGRRFLAAGQGRFIGRDPYEENGGKNLYAICLNNPVDKWDYLGMLDGTTVPFGPGTMLDRNRGWGTPDPLGGAILGTLGAVTFGPVILVAGADITVGLVITYPSAAAATTGVAANAAVAAGARPWNAVLNGLGDFLGAGAAWLSGFFRKQDDDTAPQPPNESRE